MKKKQTPIEQKPCRYCEQHYDPNYKNLGATGEPILCKCKLKDTMVFYNIIETKCPKNEK